MKVCPFLDTKHTRDLNLRENDVFRQGANQPVIEDLLWLRKRSPYIERPRPGCAADKAKALGQNQCNDCDAQKDEEDEKKCFHDVTGKARSG